MEENKKKITISDIADYFITKNHEYGDYITNLKLQKLVYYAQAWYLAFLDKPLFDEDFEAWVHGPVNRDLYDRYFWGKSIEKSCRDKSQDEEI